MGKGDCEKCGHRDPNAETRWYTIRWADQHIYRAPSFDMVLCERDLARVCAEGATVIGIR
jgi:hypothetical protein